MTPRSITTEHLRRLFADGRFITMSGLRDLHDGITKQAIQQKLGSGQLPRPLGRISGRDVWDKQEVLDYMWRR